MKKGTKLQPAPAPQANTQPAITVGLDLSDRNLHFCEIDADGEIIAESRIPLTAAALRKQFGGREKLRIALETGAQSGWGQRELQAMARRSSWQTPARWKPSTATATREINAMPGS